MAELDKHLVKKLTSHGDPKSGKGCVTKCEGSEWKDHHGSYRKNGYDHIVGDAARKKIYERNFTVKANKDRLPARVREKPLGDPLKGRDRLPADPRKNADAWKFKGENYKKGYLPFNHNYHHILPWDVLKGTMTYPEVDAIQLSTYNINDGLNLIILPESVPYATALGLWTHPDDHPLYSKEVKSVLSEAKQIINPKRGHKVNQENKDKFKKLFELWEEPEFWKIVASAETHTQKFLAESIDNHTPSKMKGIAATL